MKSEAPGTMAASAMALPWAVPTSADILLVGSQTEVMASLPLGRIHRAIEVEAPSSTYSS